MMQDGGDAGCNSSRYIVMNAQQRHECPAIVLIAYIIFSNHSVQKTHEIHRGILRFTTLSQLSSRYCGLLSAVGSLCFLHAVSSDFFPPMESIFQVVTTASQNFHELSVDSFREFWRSQPPRMFFQTLLRNGITLPETNIAPKNRQSQKETSIPTIHF